MERGVNVDSVRARLRAVGTIVDAVPKVLPTGIAFEFLFAGDLDAATIERFRADGIAVDQLDPDQALAAAAAGIDSQTLGGSVAHGSEAVAAAPGHIVRVELSRLDELMRMIGDLVISRARLDDALAAAERHVPAREWRAIGKRGPDRTAAEGLRGRRDPRAARSRAEDFQRMRFVVRDLEREIQTKVRLDLRGQQTEIDKYLIERMMDPVLDLVRNAVTHGFEIPAERLAAGKPAEGTLTLSAVGVGDSVLLEIADDGRGWIKGGDRARPHAWSGVARRGARRSHDPRFDLRARFRRATRIDRASGRGVGMSVVRTTVRELNGRISMSTTPGRAPDSRSSCRSRCRSPTR